MLGLEGMTFVYGPPGSGKTTFTAWYVFNNYERAFWVSAFEDEGAFRRNMAALGYDFGERLTFWEVPLAGVEPFFRHAPGRGGPREAAGPGDRLGDRAPLGRRRHRHYTQRPLQGGQAGRG